MLNTVAGISLSLTLGIIAAAVAAVMISGGTPVQAAAWAAVLALATRVLPILATFPIAYWPGRQDCTPPLAPSMLAGTVAREIWATIRLFFFYHPFEKLVARLEPDYITAGDTPIVLVHGFFSNAGFWESMKPALRSAGRRNLFSLNLEPPFRNIQDYVGQLESRIEDACTRSGSGSVVLVAHSMGGLVARACAPRVPQRIRHIVCLGTPHYGTLLASLVPWENTRQMRAGSSWLHQLNSAGHSGVPITNIYSAHDNIIVPHTSAALDGAKNLPIKGVGHLDMAFSRAVRESLVRVLNTECSTPST